jgi:hypothetical protein
MNEGLQVVMVSAYYKNDKPGGIGVSLTFDVPGSGAAFCQGMEECLTEYDKLSVEELLDGLAKLSVNRPDSQFAAAEAIMGVYWLQERGHLESDEYNGTMFNCMFRGTLVNSEKNPVTLDLASEMASKNAINITDIIKASKVPGLDHGLTASIRAVIDHARKGGT